VKRRVSITTCILRLQESILTFCNAITTLVLQRCGKMCEVNGFAPQPHRHCGLAKPLIWIFWAPFISYFLLALKESTKQYKSKIYCRIIAMNAEISRVSQKGHHPFLFCYFHVCYFHVCYFLLLLQKKVTKEKESGKDNLALFVRPLHRAILAPPKRARFAPFPVCPRTWYNKIGAIMIHIRLITSSRWKKRHPAQAD